MIPRRFFWLIDAGAFCAAFLVAYRINGRLTALIAANPYLSRVLGWGGPLPDWMVFSIQPSEAQAWVLITVVLAGNAALATLGGDRNLLDQSWFRMVASSVVAPLVGLSLVALILFALHSEWSRLFITSFIALSMAALLLWRVVLRLYFQQRMQAGVYARHVLLVGSPNAVSLLAREIDRAPHRELRQILGFLRTADALEAQYPMGVPCLGTVERLETLLVREPVHEVIVAQPTAAADWLPGVVVGCDQVGVQLRVVPEVLLFHRLQTLGAKFPAVPVPLPAVLLAPPHVDSDAIFLKRLMDVVVSAVLLTALSPLLAAIAVAIKLTSPGPILYRWRVIGENGREFVGYKFRTMVVNAEALKAELLSQNEMRGPVFKMRHDPRVTEIGQFLRKYSLDETPQFWSVLKGDMSLVGPRPALRSELERYEFWQKRKLSTRPGITCLWQVHGRNAIVDFDEWVRMDLEYIDRWSLWLDIKILARTAWVVVAGTGV